MKREGIKVKVVSSVRVDQSVLERLQAYNNIRQEYGLKPYSIGHVLECSMDWFISQDKRQINATARAMANAFEEEFSET